MRSLVLCAWASMTLLSGCAYDCNASNCADGCCGANGVCYVGASHQYCGLEGAACQDCSAQDKLCGAGTCQLKCVVDSPCQERSDCCPSLSCRDGFCVKCPNRDEECWGVGSCCGRLQCLPNDYLWVCQ